MFGEEEATLISFRHKTSVKTVLHSMAAYWGSGLKVPLIFDHAVRWSRSSFVIFSRYLKKNHKILRSYFYISIEENKGKKKE